VRTRLITAIVAIAAALLAVATPGAAAEPSQPEVEVLVRGAPLQGANGMVFDTQDRLVVASLAGREIVAMDPRTGRVGDRYGPDAGVQASDDVTFGPDGSLYWTDLLTGEVGRRQPDGTITKQLVAPGRAEGVDSQSFVNGLTSPFTVAPDGTDLVVTSWLQGAVQVWDPESDTVVEGYEDFAGPLNAIRFQDDLVVAELATGRAVRLDAATGERTTLAQGLFVPAGLAASDDDLWVGDWASGVVWQIVADGEVLASPAPVAGGLVQPEGLALDRDGSLLVVESGLGRLTRIEPATGATSPVASGLGVAAPAVPGTPPTWVFNGVAVGATGDIYVTGDIANVVYRLNAQDG
jgi:streptogramin lyase